MLSTVSRFVPGLVFAVLAVGAVGCGQKTYDVTGQVKYNGAPLNKPDGEVVFIAPNGTQVAAAIGQDGSYRATKVPAGSNRVAVYYPNPGLQSSIPRGKPKGGQAPPPPTAPPQPYLTPDKYASADTSQLTVDVANGTVFNVEMTGPPIP